MSSRKILGLVQGYEFQKRKGSAFAKLFEQLEKQGLLVDVVDVRLPMVLQILLKLLNFSSNKIKWNAQDQLDTRRYRILSWLARHELKNISTEYDSIIQIGSNIDISKFLAEKKIACYSYHDNNVLKYIQSLPPNTVSPGKIQLAIDYEREVYSHLDGVFTMSRTLAKSFVSGFGLPEEKVHYAGFGSPFKLDRVEISKRASNQILFVATHSFERKGGFIVLEAFRKVKRKIPDTKLVLVGRDWPIKEEGVVVKGFLDKRLPSELSKYVEAFRKSTVFVMPSYNEAFGEVFIEAMSYGLPCVGTDKGVMPELIVENGAGYVVPEGDIDLLAQAIEKILLNSSLRASFAESALRCAKYEYNWRQVILRITEAMQKDVPRNSISIK